MTATAQKTHTKASAQAFASVLYMMRVGEADIEAAPRHVLPKVKGYSFVSLTAVRSLFMLPQKYRISDAEWKRYTVSDVLPELESYSEIMDVCVRPHLYGTDCLFIKPLVSRKDFLSFLGYNEEVTEDISYKDYLESQIKYKKSETGYSLYALQEQTLVGIVSEWSLVHPSYMGAHTLNSTTFADNRVFTPITNMPKVERRKILPYEIDLHASQVTILSKLIKENGFSSPFTNLVDDCLSSGKDVYIELGKVCGFAGTRGEIKKLVLKSLFDSKVGWITSDSGYVGTLNKLKRTPFWGIFMDRREDDFMIENMNRMPYDSCLRKLRKLFMRTFMTSMELRVMTEAARLIDQPFVTIHDCFAFSSEITEKNKNVLRDYASSNGLLFSVK